MLPITTRAPVPHRRRRTTGRASRRTSPSGRAPFAALAALAALAFATVGCRPDGGDAEPKQLERTVRERELPRVRTEPAQSRDMVRVFEVSTAIEAQREVTVFARAAGVVAELLAEEGDRVAAGQVLARLDDREASNALEDAELAIAEAIATEPTLELAEREALARKESAQRSWEQARRDHERNEALALGTGDRPGLISPKDLDASQLARDTARGEFEAADLAHRRAALELDNAANAIQRARVARERAALTLSYTAIESPFDGVVASRTIDVGDAVGAQTPAFVVSDPSLLRAIVNRPQRELLLFARAPATAAMLTADGGADGHADGHDGGDGGDRSPGDGQPPAEPSNAESPPAQPSNGASAASAPIAIEITARAEALPGLTFRGTVERISPTIDPSSGNFRVTVRFDPWPLEIERESVAVEAGFPARLLPGMLVRLSIVTDRHVGALVAPKRALRRQGDESVLFAVRDGRAVRIVVEEGYSDEESFEVLPVDGELAAGEPLIVVGNRDLEDGAEVEVVEQSEDAQPGADAPPEAWSE